MNLYFRFIWLLLSRFFMRKDRDVFAPCDTFFRVWPSDLDFNIHMTNSHYFAWMDLGRMDLMMQAGVFGPLFRQGYYPVAVSESIRFKEAIPPFAKVILRSSVESVDEKNFYLSQKFLYRGALVAEGYVKVRFLRRGQRGSRPSKEIFECIGRSDASVRVSPLAEAHSKLESLLVN